MASIRTGLRVGRKSNLILVAMFLLAGAPVQAQKTLMVLVDWWEAQTDTVINLKVGMPSPEIIYKGGGPPAPVRTNIYTSLKKSWWYSLPNFSVEDYSQGRIRFNTTYTRGWWQNDSHYTAVHDTSRVLPAGQVSYQYRDPVSQKDSIVFPDTNGVVVFRTGHDTAVPKLHTSPGQSITELLNQRGTGSPPMGNIDKCLDTLQADTLWLMWGTTTSLPGSNPTGVKCLGYNPYSTRYALVYLRNPWPGSNPVVEFNGQNIPLYPSTNSDWLVADLRYLKTLGVPSGSIRFKKSVGSSSYFDSSGVEQAVVMPFVVPNDGGSHYYIPSEAGGAAVSGTGTLPTPSYTIFVQNPWKPGTPRLLWESDNSIHVMRPTQSCGWYKYPLYSKPTKVLIGHSFEDSSYGSLGVQFRQRANWVTIPATAINAKGEVYIQTRDAAGNRVAATTTATPSLKDCSIDTIRLVMEAFDFKGRATATAAGAGANPAFQVGGTADNTGSASSGLAKGMVQTYLSAAGLPIWTGKDSGYQKGGLNDAVNKGASNPGNWFDTTALRAAVPGVAIGHSCLELPLSRKPSDSGYYNYKSSSFFPLDTIRDLRGMSLMSDALNVQHNFMFCLHGHAAFEYTPGLKFEFRGDDDVWVFINNKLAVDLGGTHAPESANVNLDRLRLRDGSVYPFDIFYCERQTNGSNINIRTTMDLQPSWKYRATPTVSAGKITVLIEGQKTTNYVPSCADLTNGKVIPWEKTNGRMVFVGPDGSDLYSIYNTDTSIFNGNLAYNQGTIQLDSNKLKLEPQLMWPGVYTVRVESRLGDSLYAISFTKTYGSSVVTGTVLDANGDGVADSIRLVTPRPIFADNPDYHLVWFTAAGKKDSVQPTAAQVRKVSDSIVVAPLAGKVWGERTRLPVGQKADSLGVVHTTPTGLSIFNPIKLVDGIAAVADSAYLKYDESGTGQDSLFVWASEPVTKIASAPAALAAWALLGRATSARLTVGEAASLGDGTRFVLVFDPVSNPYAAGDSLRLGGWAGDAVGNAPGAVSKWVPVQTNSVAKAWMLDMNGDGAPDSVGIASKGDLSLTDSVRVQWKTATGADTIVSIKTPSGITTGLKLPTGILGNATYCQGCRIEAFQAGTSRKFPLLDSVDAVALSAFYRYGSGSDTLIVKVSEAVVKGLDAGEGWFAHKPTGSVSGIGVLVAGGAVDSSVNGTIRMILAQGTELGDSLRLRGWAVDAFGNEPGSVSPWVAIEYGPQPIRVQVFDRDQDGRADSAVFKLTRSAAGAPVATSLGVRWNGQILTSASLVRSADLLSWSGPIGPFALGTSAAATDIGWIRIGTDSVSYRAAAEDSVAPVAIDSALYRYGPATGPDTLYVTASENLVKAGAILVKTKAGESFGSGTDLVANNKMMILVSPSTWTGADSVRLGPSAKDAQGNAPGATSKLVPVVYGTQNIRVVVWDRDGDGTIDSVAYRLTRSGSGAPTPTGFGLIWSGKAATVGALTKSADGKSWTGPVTGAAPLGTATVTDDAGWLQIGADVNSYRAKVVDSAAPVAVVAKLVYGFEEGSPDTVVVTGSEALASAANGAWLMLGKDSASATATMLSAAQVAPQNPISGGNNVSLVVPSGSIGDDARWARYGVAISDGSVAVGQSSRWVPLVITPSGRAYLFDADGDGRADSMRVAVRGTLATAVTATVNWNDSAGNAATRIWPVVPGAGSFGVRPGADKWFEKGATSCRGSCSVVFRDATGNVLVSWALVDSVAPMLVKAVYSFGGARDTIRATFSEPLQSVNPSAPWLEWGAALPGGPVNHAGAKLSTTGLEAVLEIDTASGARDGWDSLRLAAGGRAGAVKDAAGTKVGTTSPWAPVEYGIPSMVATLSDPQGTGRATDVEIRLTRQVPSSAVAGVASFQLAWPDSSGNALDRRTVAASVLSFKDGAWTGALSQPFALGSTGCLIGGCDASAAKNGSQRTMPLLDGVPPSLTWAKYRYSLPEIAQDTLVVGLSEPWEGGPLGAPELAFVQVGTSSISSPLAPWRTWTLSVDKKTLSMVVDTLWDSRIRKTDSVRLTKSSRVVDAVPNFVGTQSRWVPLAFGLRPAQLDMQSWPNGVLVNSSKNPGSVVWVEPPPTTPAVELLVRDPKDSLATDPLAGWHRVEGVEAGNPTTGGASKNPAGHLLGVKIRLNRPLQGRLIIYDNIGTAVRQIDLDPLMKLWTEDKIQKDAMRDVWIAWNGTGPDGKFAASGVYLFRAVVNVDDGEGRKMFRNLVWKLGWHRDTK
jgi:fibro-slime domain-containing protein